MANVTFDWKAVSKVFRARGSGCVYQVGKRRLSRSWTFLHWPLAPATLPVLSCIPAKSLSKTTCGVSLPFNKYYLNIITCAGRILKKMKHTSPQETVNEFWAKFNTKTPGKGELFHLEDVRC